MTKHLSHRRTNHSDKHLYTTPSVQVSKFTPMPVLSTSYEFDVHSDQTTDFVL